MSSTTIRAANGHPAPFNIKFWGIGNEMWGCGGHFSPEDYASEFRRFASFMPDFAGQPLTLIACGPDGNDLDWTRRFFDHLDRHYKPFPRIHGYAPHYYCGTAGTAIDYCEAQWYELLWKAARMEDLIVQQRALMDEYDPHRKIGMMIDEWGTWHPPHSRPQPQVSVAAEHPSRRPGRRHHARHLPPPRR